MRRKSNRLAPVLVGWFEQNARDLPWRRTNDPYAIWVSEIMLQQTQVRTAIPYFERWMRALPTVESLARISSGRLHKLWEGLGYYTRVRNLQKSARMICQDHNAQFPQQYDAVRALPGIGPYTAGAICSIAFNQPTPILDGNVIRVLSRVFAITSDPKEPRTNTLLWQLAEALVTRAARLSPPSGCLPCSALNQSLMELGATLCTPRSPSCPLCPVQPHCGARQRGIQEQLPLPARRPATTQRHFLAFLVEHKERYLVRQRPDGMVNAHLWEFPNAEVKAPLSTKLDATARKMGLRIIDRKPLCTLKHSITRYRITLAAHRAEVVNLGTLADGHWFTRRQLDRLAFTSAHRQILRAATL
ncbi:MAG: A/G-specific adenine glycosylase [Verrucomicrobia bacterium]|jgi:A/G-specific adenine glycosylase|nr:A/G-specific adenine glycosylase [Verrucomicrobiota bacterium]